MYSFADDLDAAVTRAKEAGMDLDSIIGDLESMIAGLESEIDG